MTSTIFYGSAILWVVHWSANGAVAAFVGNFKKYIGKKLLESDGYPIFDRYLEYSKQSVGRSGRESEASRQYHWTENTPLPSNKDIITVVANKAQLTSFIYNSIPNNHAFQRLHTTRNKFCHHRQ